MLTPNKKSQINQKANSLLKNNKQIILTQHLEISRKNSTAAKIFQPVLKTRDVQTLSLNRIPPLQPYIYYNQFGQAQKYQFTQKFSLQKQNKLPNSTTPQPEKNSKIPALHKHTNSKDSNQQTEKNSLQEDETKVTRRDVSSQNTIQDEDFAIKTFRRIQNYVEQSPKKSNRFNFRYQIKETSKSTFAIINNNSESQCNFKSEDFSEISFKENNNQSMQLQLSIIEYQNQSNFIIRESFPKELFKQDGMLSDRQQEKVFNDQPYVLDKSCQNLAYLIESYTFRDRQNSRQSRGKENLTQQVQKQSQQTERLFFSKRDKLIEDPSKIIQGPRRALINQDNNQKTFQPQKQDQDQCETQNTQTTKDDIYLASLASGQSSFSLSQLKLGEKNNHCRNNSFQNNSQNTMTQVKTWEELIVDVRKSDIKFGKNLPNQTEIKQAKRKVQLFFDNEGSFSRILRQRYNVTANAGCCIFRQDNQSSFNKQESEIESDEEMQENAESFIKYELLQKINQKKYLLDEINSSNSSLNLGTAVFANEIDYGLQSINSSMIQHQNLQDSIAI